MTTWDKTTLWQTLQGRGDSAAPVRLQLERAMPTIQTVLAQGGTATRDFTLHDAAHGFRVAQMMARLTPAETLSRLSPYELALLLLSAYLHDIGMMPAYDLIDRHNKYILTKGPDLLSPEEIRDLRHWLDQERGGIELPVAADRLTVGDLRVAEELTAYYGRHRHNDWSELWIAKTLPDHMTPLYSTFLEDLITLCRSHHEGLQDLRASRFEPKSVGNPGQTVNLRYLAAVLRVADVLEFDPERTPAVLLEHRAIPAKSRPFWLRDHVPGFVLEPDRGLIRFSAQTKDAHMHRAVLDTAEWVDEELRCCATLNQEGAFRSGSIPDDRRSIYDWPWGGALARGDIRPLNDSFVYIEGGFRPDTRKILELLSGTSLYESPLAAVREILQNAFDAVREQIALRRLGRANPADPKWERHFAEEHSVTLSLEREGDDWFLICTDDGIGMSKAVIEKQFLVSGSGPSAHVRDLERRARDHHFTTGRTGQFGIGVLSYFILADMLDLTTRRSQEGEGPEPDGKGWQFSIDGLAGFGQLSQAARTRHGTQLRLRLKRDQVGGDGAAFAKKLAGYVKRALVWIPCHFSYRCPTVPAVDFSSAPGWVRQVADIRDEVLGSFVSDNHIRWGVKSAQTEASEREKADYWSRVREEAAQRLRFSDPVEWPLPNGLGRLRLIIPYFAMPEGNSLLYFPPLGERFPDGGVIRLSDSIATAWKGFSVRFGDYGGPLMELSRTFSAIGLVLDIVLENGGSVDVNRGRLKLSPETKAAINASINGIHAHIRLLTNSWNDSAYLVSSCAAANVPISVVPDWHYQRTTINTNIRKRFCKSFHFPVYVFSRPVLGIAYIDKKPIQNTHLEVRKTLDHSDVNKVSPLGLVAPTAIKIYCNHITFVFGNSMIVTAVLYWDSAPTLADLTRQAVRLPGNWTDVALVVDPFGHVWSNAAHPISKSWQLQDNQIAGAFDQKSHLEALPSSVGSVIDARTWFTGSLDAKSEFWQAAYDRQGAAMTRLLELVFNLCGDDHACVWHTQQNGMWCFTRHSFKAYDRFASAGQAVDQDAFPLPDDPEWIIGESPPET